MLRVVTCLDTQHDWSLVLLAGLVCFFTSIAAINLFHRALATIGRARLLWLVTTAAAAGYGIWATHFIAMLAFSPGLPVGFDLLITLASLLAATLVTGAGFALATAGRDSRAASVGGAIVGLGIAVMHYAGMRALELPGHIVWAPDLVAASIVFGVGFGIAAVNVGVRFRGLWSTLSAALLLALAILALHFTGMGAVEIIPDPTVSITTMALSHHTLAIAIASAAAAFLGTSLIAVFAASSRQQFLEASDAKFAQQAARFETTLANMSQGVCMFDKDKRVVVANRAYAELYGLESIVPGTTIREILEARIARGTYANIDAQEFVETGVASFNRDVREILHLADGRVISVLRRPMPDGGLISTHEDITEREELHSRLRERTLQFDMALNNISQGLCFFDGTQRLVICNNRYVEMYDLQPGSVSPGMTLDEIIDLRRQVGSSPVMPQEDYHAWRNSVAVSGDTVVELVNGHVIEIHHRTMPDGGWVATHEDITQKRQAEDLNRLTMERLRTTQNDLTRAVAAAEASNEAKSSFLANMSHEIRTPLNGVLGMAQSLQNDALSLPQREKVAIILESGNTLMTVLNDVLDLSKIEAGKLEISCVDGDIVKAVGRIRRLFLPQAEEKRLSIDFHCPPDFPRWLYFDPVRVRQCLSNLLSNAIKFTETGTITIAMSSEPRDGGYLLSIAVVDTGIGITPDTMASLFSAFTQADASTSRRFGGTGLGLTVARQLARMMGGDVTATSEAGRGSTFTFSFRAAVASRREEDLERAADSAVPQVRDGSQLRHARILLTDDNAINRRVIKMLLAPLGVSITEAVNGREALDKLAAERFDLVLLDIHMPVMDGRQTIEAIRRSVEAWRTIPVIALTANAMSGDREKYLSLGMDDYVSKPVDQRELHTKLIAMLGMQDAAAATG